jgi:hypothetical protein
MMGRRGSGFGVHCGASGFAGSKNAVGLTRVWISVERWKEGTHSRRELRFVVYVGGQRMKRARNLFVGPEPAKATRWATLANLFLKSYVS